MTTETLSIDIETFSSENLAKSGVYRYAEAPDFKVLLFGCSVNGGPVFVYDLASGDKLPAEIIDALLDESVLKCAFNASFERVCLSRYLRDMCLLPPGKFLSPVGWRCTMIRCAYLGLPLSLANAGVVLGLDKQKLTEGKDLIRFFCLPAKPSLMNEQTNRNGPTADLNRWLQFVEYNRRDVEVEMQIQERLKNHPVPESVWKEYELDQEINDRGIRVDERLVSAAFAMDGISREELTSELSRLTQLSNPNSVSQIRSWLTAHGSEMESLGKKEVAAMLKDADPEIREVLILRQQLAKSSVKKYEAMRNTACADGRVRGMFQFYGASRSGRWAGRGVQLQNLPQNHLPDLDQARDTVLAGDYGTVKMLYDSVPDVLSELIRTAFVPAEGKKFIVADFSAIEARVIAWLAGEAWRTEVFASGGDIYCASAERMGERLGRFIGGYREQYFVPDRWGYGQVFSWKLRPGADEAIWRRIQDITVSMKSVDHLKMPECVMNKVSVHMDEKEKAQYETLKEELFLRVLASNKRVVPEGVWGDCTAVASGDSVAGQSLDKRKAPQVLTIDAKNASVLCGKLAQLSNGAVYTDNGQVAHIHDRKLDALEDLVESAGGNPLLVAYWFQHDLWRMKERFPDLRVLRSSEDIRDWNAGKIPLAAIHPASAGHGLNLQAGGSTLVWFGLTWSLELYQQTNARLWRQGQKAETVVIHHLVTEGTIDERILQALKGKDQSQDRLIEAVKAQLGERRFVA